MGSRGAQRGVRWWLGGGGGGGGSGGGGGVNQTCYYPHLRSPEGDSVDTVSRSTTCTWVGVCVFRGGGGVTASLKSVFGTYLNFTLIQTALTVYLLRYSPTAGRRDYRSDESPTLFTRFPFFLYPDKI